MNGRWRQAAAFGACSLLAAATAWWAHRPAEMTDAVSGTVASPVYGLRDAVLEETGPDGRWRLRIEAEEARESAPASREIDLSGVQAVYHPGSPRAWQLQARSGRLPADSGRLVLSGDVRLRPADGSRGAEASIRTSRLEVDLDRERATTRAPVQVDFGKHALLARGLDADMKAGTVRLESDLHGTFQR